MRLFRCGLILFFAAVLSAQTQDGGWLQFYNNGIAAIEAGDYANGRAALAQAWEQAKRFEALDPRRGLSARALASVLQVDGSVGQAEPLLAEARSIFEASGVESRANLALTLDGLGELRVEQGRFQEAMELYKQGLELNLETRGGNDPLTALSYRHLGELYAVQSNAKEAEAALKQSIAILRLGKAPSGAGLACALEALARTYLPQRRIQEAEILLKESLELKQSLPEKHPARADVLLSLAMVYRLEGNSARAEPLLRKALAIYEAANDPRRASVLGELAGLANDEKKYTTAERYASEVLRIVQEQLGPDHINVATAGNWLALVYMEEGKYAKAEKLVERSLQIQRKIFGGDHPEIAKSLAVLAAVNAKAHSEAAAARFPSSIQPPDRTIETGDQARVNRGFRSSIP